MLVVMDSAVRISFLGPIVGNIALEVVANGVIRCHHYRLDIVWTTMIVGIPKRVRDGVPGIRRVDARKLVTRKLKIHSSQCQNVDEVSHIGCVNRVRIYYRTQECSFCTQCFFYLV